MTASNFSMLLHAHTQILLIFHGHTYYHFGMGRVSLVKNSEYTVKEKAGFSGWVLLLGGWNNVFLRPLTGNIPV